MILILKMEQLSEHTDQKQNLIPRSSTKSPNQVRALFLKNASLQSKQVGTNICQILTPIICLLFTYIIQVIVQDNIHAEQQNFSFPLPLNVQIPPILKDYVQLRCLQWYEYSVEGRNVDMNFLGLNNGKYGARKGFLGNSKIVNENCQFVYKNVSDYWVTTPFFRQNNQSDGLVQDIADRLVFLRNESIGQEKAVLPDGAVRFRALSNNSLNATLLINDCRTFDYHRANGITAIRLRPNTSVNYQFFLTVPEGQIAFADLLNSAYSKTITNKSINTGLIYFPVVNSQQALITNIINLAASTIFPISLSLLLPVFLYAIVLQKQQKLIQMMRMNGMRMRYYWLVNFLFNLILSCVTVFIFFVFGRFILKNSLFTDSNTFLLVLTLAGWMLAQIGMATLFQTFISHSNSANIIGYLLSIWTSMIAVSLNVALYQYPQQFPYLLKMYAPFSFNRIMYILLSKCSIESCVRSMSGLDTEVVECLVYMYLNFVVFQVLGMYLYEVIPQEYGVNRSPLFPLRSVMQWWKRSDHRNEETEKDDQRFEFMELGDEDGEAAKERERTLGMRPEEIRSYPLVCNNLRKLYKKEGLTKPFAAVKSLNLVVEHNEIFGLLGPNGAGKTTLISLITGMYSPNSGNAWVGGYSIRNQLEKVHLEMGVCPQFDLLWPTLTVEEHLYFYARLKGTKLSEEQQKVIEALEEVNLLEFKKFRANQLSGGMKRRLSVAISLVGDPQIVFMDEPTTGLDPQNRRDLWSVLAKCRAKRSVFLTTHMMDQADTLCNRIGILTKGTLRTVGNQVMLRNKYGGGYRLDINLGKEEKMLQEMAINDSVGEGSEERYSLNRSLMTENEDLEDEEPEQVKVNSEHQKLLRFMENSFPESTLCKRFNNNFAFSLGHQKYLISQVFQQLQRSKSQLGIKNWGVINSSLEDVFLTVVNKFDGEAKPEATSFE